MKTLLSFILLFAAQCLAVDLAFEWDAAPAEFQIESYNVYEVTGVTEVVKLGNTKTPEFTIQNVTPGEHSYYVTLVNLWGESVAYAEGKTPPVFNPEMEPGKLKFKTINLQASHDLRKWDTFVSIPVEEKDRVFYRIAFKD